MTLRIMSANGRRMRIVVSFCVAGMLLLSAGALRHGDGSTAPLPTPSVTASSPGLPVRLRIPSIGVDAPVERVGLTKTGAMDVPRNPFRAGWYDLAAIPGNRGNAVMAGHLDAETGAPAIFWNLHKMKPGQDISVEDASGNVRVFRVASVETFPYDAAPMRRIFGTGSVASLNLITCKGEWDGKIGKYEERLVVFAEAL